MALEDVSAAAVAQLMKDLNISQPTAEFIYQFKSFPASATGYPSNTPLQDLINIKRKTLSLSPDDAEWLVNYEKSLIPLQSSVTQTTNVIVSKELT